MPDFPHPLDTDIVEEQEIERQQIVPDGQDEFGRLRFKTEKVKEKVQVITRYTKAEPKFLSCKDGHHHWEMIDRHKHIAKCKDCPKHRFLRAVYETIDKDGHIVDRDTNMIID
jgi:hypothetical protein